MADGSILTGAAGLALRVLTGLGLANAGQQVVTLADQFGNLALADPDGTTQVSARGSGLFLDDFSGTLASTFTTGGTTAPTVTAGVLSTSAATTASATSYVRTIASFTLRSGSFLRQASLVKLETTALVNSTRWWGLGLNQTTPTAAAPVLNGAVFQLDYTNGGLYAVTYSAGTRTNFIAITRPSDGNTHRYEVWYRQSVIYWAVDNVVVASAPMPNLAVANNLATVIGSANFTTAPTAGPLLQVTSVGVVDHSGTNSTISDGAQPWVQATVKTASATAAATDQGLVVHLHPNSPLAGSSNRIGAVAIGSATLGNVAAVTTAAVYNAAIKTSSGSLHEFTVSNPTSTAAYVKLYNVAGGTVTVGTTVPLATYRVAASGSPGDTLVLYVGTNGKAFSAGIGLAITGGPLATDTTATVAGIQISAMYS